VILFLTTAWLIALSEPFSALFWLLDGSWCSFWFYLCSVQVSLHWANWRLTPSYWASNCMVACCSLLWVMCSLVDKHR
jgi:hypothetical protein